MDDRLRQALARAEEVARELSDPATTRNPAKRKQLGREHAQLDDIRQTYEKRPATRPIRIGTHTVEPGTMAALRFEVQGIVGGRPALVVEHVTRLDDDLATALRRLNVAP